jgi:hypothetical protein
MPTNWLNINDVHNDVHWYTSRHTSTAWDTGYTYYRDPRQSKEQDLINELNRLIALHHNDVDHISIAETIENARRKGDCSESKYRWIYQQIRRPVPGDIVFRGANCQQDRDGHIERVNVAMATGIINSECE